MQYATRSAWNARRAGPVSTDVPVSAADVSYRDRLADSNRTSLARDRPRPEDVPRDPPAKMPGDGSLSGTPRRRPATWSDGPRTLRTGSHRPTRWKAGTRDRPQKISVGHARANEPNATASRRPAPIVANAPPDNHSRAVLRRTVDHIRRTLQGSFASETECQLAYRCDPHPKPSAGPDSNFMESDP